MAKIDYLVFGRKTVEVEGAGGAWTVLLCRGAHKNTLVLSIGDDVERLDVVLDEGADVIDRDDQGRAVRGGEVLDSRRMRAFALVCKRGDVRLVSVLHDAARFKVQASSHDLSRERRVVESLAPGATAFVAWRSGKVRVRVSGEEDPFLPRADEVVRIDAERRALEFDVSGDGGFASIVVLTPRADDRREH
jgi:hypothetical protein